ncbi:MAG: site-specific DNA-methyltransferase [Campylobacterota bacterium]|nr:site-specific DNA-methyltransferase [Campylobacterota bacterium]
MDLHSKDLHQKKLDELKTIFPEIFEDGLINYDKFKTILGEQIDEKSEHYSFNWSGKKECYQTIKAKTNTTLKVDKDKIEPDGDNIFIEGDNLEVLKLLQNAYHKKVKMIYIDPPYNKDKDFVYKDTWGDTIQNYMAQTDQLREEGYTSTKTNATGRRHTNWLNMIYPRLWLSRNLLKDDGVIFVSIDDDEVHNLRKVMDEIYGEENFVGQIILKTNPRGSQSGDDLAIVHEYLLVYCKNNRESIIGLPLGEKLKAEYKLLDDNNKNYRLLGLRQRGGAWRRSDRPSLYYPIYINPINKKISLNKSDEFHIEVLPVKPTTNEDGSWRWSRDKITKDIKFIVAKKITRNYEEDWDIFQIDYLDNPEGEKRTSAKTIWDEKEVNYQNGTVSVKQLFENKDIFSFPKPIYIIQQMIKMINFNNDDIILDFFAGSGTTAHAVMDLNAEDGGNRKYILVQLPEATDEKSEAYKNNYKRISDITKARIKKVIKNLDYKDGFKSFYLDNSNFQKFKELKKRPNDSLETIEKMLKMSVFQENILTQGAKPLDLVYEIGLKNGFTLSAKTQTLQSGVYNFIKLYEDEREFYFCFDKEIANDIVNAVPKAAKLICYEKALGDSVKLNLHSNLDLETL